MIELNQCSCPLQWVHAAVLLQIGSVEHCHLHFIYQQRLTAEANNIGLLFTLLLNHLHYISLSSDLLRLSSGRPCSSKIQPYFIAVSLAEFK